MFAALESFDSAMNDQDHTSDCIADYRTVRLDPDLICLPLDEDFVIFSERTQSLLSLNASAALVIEMMRDGMPAAKAADELVARELAHADDAARWVESTLAALDAHGMLRDRPRVMKPVASSSDANDTADAVPADMPALAAFVPQRVAHYRLLETCAEIRFALPQQMRLVDSVVGHLKVDNTQQATLVIDLPGTLHPDDQLSSLIYKNGEPVGRADRLSSLAPKVKNTLWLSAVNAHDFLFYIHAGVVRSGNGCILLPAAAGSGKSSLTGALTQKGLGYYSDEVALIDRVTYRVPPVPLAICVKSTGWNVLERYFPVLPTLPVHRRDDGKIVRYIPPPATALAQPPLPVRHIVFPRHSQDETTELKPISRSEALARLMDQCLALRQHFDAGNIAELVGWIGKIRCYSLTFSSLDDAADLVIRMASSN